MVLPGVGHSIVALAVGQFGGEFARMVSALTRDVEGVRNRQIRVSARRLAAVQKRALSDASRSGRISDGVARKLARHIDIELDDHPPPGSRAAD